MATDAAFLARQLGRDVAAELDARIIWRGLRPYAVTRQDGRSAEVALPSNLLTLDEDTRCELLARAAHRNAETLRSTNP